MSFAVRSEFKGNPVIVLKRSEGDKFSFSFGATKARLIVENFEEIRKFAEDNPPKERQTREGSGNPSYSTREPEYNR